MKVICPKCKSEHTAPIMYGYPASEAWEASERGEIILGGCMVFPHQEDYVRLIWHVHGCTRSMQMELQENMITKEDVEKHYFLKKNKCRSERQLN